MRVLITGAGSYIGTQLMQTLLSEGQRFAVRELDVQNGVDAAAFRDTDAVVHVAGIAHRKAGKNDGDLYQRVNCQLALECARAAKAAGVKQFVFFSSMSVYGMTTGRIDAHTLPSPNTFYGQSKLNAEKGLETLASEDFRVAVLRPPMVYGRGCGGNYTLFSAMARKLPVFPRVSGQRSMIYIETLCRFVQSLLESGQGGLFFPQNPEYVNVSDMAREIARCHGKKLLLVPGADALLQWLGGRVGLSGKVFGTLIYDRAMSAPFPAEEALSFARTIELTEVEHEA